MLVEGALFLWLTKAPLSSPPGGDNLHRPAWYEMIDLVCPVAGDQRSIDSNGGRINLDLFCPLPDDGTDITHGGRSGG